MIRSALRVLDRVRAAARATFMRTGGLANRARMDERLDEEMRFHLDMSTDRLVSRGIAPDDARRQAFLAFGGRTRMADDARDAYRNRFIEHFGRDVRFAIRVLRRNPGFTLPSVLTLALGIGATTAIYSMVEAVVLRPLPYENPKALTAVWERNVESSNDRNVVSVPTFEAWRDRTHSFSSLAAAVPEPSTLIYGGIAERLMGARVTPEFFRLLGVTPAFGRDFAASEGESDGAHVVILSDALWRTRFAGDSAVLGRSIQLDDVAYTVIGVMPTSFDPPRYFWLSDQDFWLPFAANAQNRSWGRFLLVIGRLRSGATTSSAQRELVSLAAQRAKDDPKLAHWSATVVPLAEQITGDVRSPMLVVLIAAVLLLMMAITNVANLTLAFTRRRSAELATRASIGASRRRLLAQLMTQSTVLVVLGTMIGVGVAFVGIGALRALIPPNIPRAQTIGLDVQVLLIVLVLAAASAAAIGLVAALRGTSTMQRLASHSMRASPRFGSGFLVIAEVALGLVLGVLAGLMVRSFAELRSVNLGFDASQAIVTRVGLAGDRYASADAQRNAFQELLQRLRAMPGVDAAGIVDIRPLGRAGTATGVFDPRRPFLPGTELPVADIRVADRDYFHALRVPLLAGSLAAFDQSSGGPPVAVVSAEMAKTLWGREQAVGRTIHIKAYDDLEARVVAVVADVHLMNVRTPPRATAYISPKQFPSTQFDVVVRGSIPESALISSTRSALASVDRNVPAYDAVPMSSIVARSLARDKFTTFLLAMFGSVSLLLAAIGIYGVFSGDVAQRSKELGIRLALGSSAPRVAALVLSRAIKRAACGVVLGAVLALVLARSMASFLYGVPANDVSSFGVVSVIVLFVAIVASLIPAVRAARVSPLAAIRLD